MRDVRIIVLALLLAAGCAKDRYTETLTVAALPPPSAPAELDAFRVHESDDPSEAFGVPITETPVIVLRNIGYTSGYSTATGTPLWVSYRVFADPVYSPGPRLSRFLRDERVPDPVVHRDYSNSGYDRGHMAPNAAIARRYGHEAQRETYLMSNIVPQLPGLNQRGWQAVESLIDIEWAERMTELWVFTGPIFEGECLELETDVHIPSACYMIVVDIDDRAGTVHALGIIMEQRRIDEEPLSAFTVTVDEIEAATGIDFLHAIDDAVEFRVESAPADARWETQQVLRPRFPGTPRPLAHRVCD